MPTGVERGANLLELATAVDARETGTDVADADYLPTTQDEPENTTHIFAGRLEHTLRSMERLPFDAAPMEAVSFKDSPTTARKPRRVSPLKRPMNAPSKRGWKSGIVPFAAPILVTLLGLGVWQAVRTKPDTTISAAAPAARLEATPQSKAAAAQPVEAAPLPSAAKPAHAVVTQVDHPQKAVEKAAPALAKSSAPPKPTAAEKTSQLPGAVFVTTPGGGDVYDHGKLLGHAPREFELSPGPHTLMIKSGTDTRTVTVVVPAGAAIMVSVPPSNPPPAATPAPSP
jgi:hypothetical protein